MRAFVRGDLAFLGTFVDQKLRLGGRPVLAVVLSATGLVAGDDCWL